MTKIGGKMTAEELNAYLVVLVDNSVSAFNYEEDGCKWAVTLSPKLDFTKLPPDSSTGHNWRGPSNLDNGDILYKQIMGNNE